MKTLYVATAGAVLLLLAGWCLSADSPKYDSVTVDENGQLHITLDSRKQLLAPRTRAQIAFDAPRISPDQRTVGWLALYPYPNAPKGQTLAGTLVVYRAGRILHAFPTEQVYWDWQFRDDGKRVAYSTGPTHGGAAECVLRDLDSGLVVAHWSVKDGEPPAWAQDLRT